MAVNDILLDRGIRHAVFLERLKTGEVDKILRLLNQDVIPDLKKQVGRIILTSGTAEKGLAATKRMRQLSRSIDGVVRGGMRSAGASMKKSLGDIALNEAAFHTALLRDTMPIAVDFVTPSAPLLRAIVTEKPFQGKLLKTWFNDLGSAAKRNITTQLNIGLVEGESIPALTKRFQTAMAITKRQADAVVRTAVNHVTTQAREATYAENSDIIKEVQYVATLDHRTTEICASLDGRVFPINEGPRSPQHIRCRSTTVPITKSWKELGIPLKDTTATTRASMNGQVAVKTTYPEWLKKQTNDIQAKVLGKGKAKLFREGKYDLRKRITNKPLTLKQLKAIEASKPKAVPKPRPIEATKSRLKAAPKPADDFDTFRTKFRNDTAGMSIKDKLRKARHLDDKVMKLRKLKSPESVQFEVEAFGEELADLNNKLHSVEASGPAGLTGNEAKWWSRRDKVIQNIRDLHKKSIPNLQDATADIIGKGYKGAPVQVSTPTRHSGSFLAKNKEAQRFMGRVLAEEEGYTLKVGLQETFNGGRAFADRRAGIFLAPADSAAVHVHELTHHVEFFRKNALETVKEFREFRLAKAHAGRRKLVSLQKISPKAGYRSDEVFQLEHWDKGMPTQSASYTGKLYASEAATEVLTMGVQTLFTDAGHLARLDPEFCKFLLGVLDGSLL